MCMQKAPSLAGRGSWGHGAVASTESAIRAGDACTTEGMLLISSLRPDTTKSDENVPSGLSAISLSYWTPHRHRTKLIADIAFYNQF